jgi:hypothetical protein
MADAVADARAQRRRKAAEPAPAAGDASQAAKTASANAPAAPIAHDDPTSPQSPQSPSDRLGVLEDLAVEEPSAFYVPGAVNAGQSEQSYADIIRSAEGNTGQKVRQRRILRIEFEHEGSQHTAQVGQSADFNGEMVFAILEADAYLICTTNRGTLRGAPVIVDRESVQVVEEFPEPAPAAGAAKQPS